ncbi:MAG: TIGR03435 family protein [Bryobacteraceae bacterium]|jgi:uncharacterized protein (TIGR03435 family)
MMSTSFLQRMSAGLVLAAGAALGQTPVAGPAFEVASVKPAGPLDAGQLRSGQRHVGMSIDAARVDIGSLSLADLIRIAYRVKPNQISGPDWMASERFDVLAKLPEGASRDQVPEMLQALLAERFKLAVHRESKERAVYALVVGKNGPKLKESSPDADAPAPDGANGGAGAPLVLGGANPQVRVTGRGENTSVVVSGGPSGTVHMSMGPNGALRLETPKMTLAALADLLSRFVDRPVVDMTELSGTYQVALDLSLEDMRSLARTAGIAVPGRGAGGDAARTPADAASDPPGSSVFAAVQQLGLKLEPRKAPIDFIVVDHLEKIPTEN